MLNVRQPLTALEVPFAFPFLFFFAPGVGFCNVGTEFPVVSSTPSAEPPAAVCDGSVVEALVMLGRSKTSHMNLLTSSSPALALVGERHPSAAAFCNALSLTMVSLRIVSMSSFAASERGGSVGLFANVEYDGIRSWASILKSEYILILSIGCSSSFSS